MKSKLLTAGLFVVMAIMGCGGADQNDASNADTNQIDTSMSTQDTTMYGDTTNMDTNTKQNGSNSNIR